MTRRFGDKVLQMGHIEEKGSMLRSGEMPVERVINARERKLRELIRTFQNQRNTSKSHSRWKKIEKEVFGVEYND